MTIRAVLVASMAILAGLVTLGWSDEKPAGDKKVEESTNDKKVEESTIDKAAVGRARKTVKMLDDIYKQTIVLITDKYVQDEDDYPAGSAAVTLFENITKIGSHRVRLLDATGQPYKKANVAKDDFEKAGIKKLKAGAPGYEEVITEDGKPFLRSMTPVPVVMEKCIMCHSHYEDAKKGEAIGAISYTIPIE